MTRLEDSVTVTQRQLVNAQSTIVTMKGEHDEYCGRLGVEEKGHGSLEALLRCLCRRWVDHT